MKSMKSSIVSYKQSLQNQGGVNYTNRYSFLLLTYRWFSSSKRGRMWMYEYRFLMIPKYNQTRLLQQTFKVKQTEIASRLIEGQANKIKKKIRPLFICQKNLTGWSVLASNKSFSTTQGTCNRLSDIVIDYQRQIANGLFKKGFEIWILNLVIDYQ